MVVVELRLLWLRGLMMVGRRRRRLLLLLLLLLVMGLWLLLVLLLLVLLMCSQSCRSLGLLNSLSSCHGRTRNGVRVVPERGKTWNSGCLGADQLAVSGVQCGSLVLGSGKCGD